MRRRQTDDTVDRAELTRGRARMDPVSVVPGGRFAGAIVLAVVLLVGCGGETTDARSGDGADGTEVVDEEVTIAADGLDLLGTLRLPAAAPPYPAVAIAHGSGPQSRRGLVPGQLGLSLPRPVPVYEQLAEGLRDAGIAVLTWDKRSCGPFNGCADNGYPTPPEDLTFATFVEDVAAVLDHLAARDDTSDVALVGHSKGGTIAGLLAADRADLATVVLLSTPAVPIDEVLVAQAEKLADLVEAASQQGSAADEVVASLHDLAAEVAEVADGEATGPAIGGASRTFWASWIEASRQAPERLHAATVPVLVVGGDHDWNVPPEQVRAWEGSLPAGSRIEIQPELTHALTRLGTDDPAAITPRDVGTQVDASLIETVVDWLEGTLDR